jgi:hypothetical protein
MAAETLTITKLQLQNNYIIVSGDQGEKGKTRPVQFFYPKVNTNFNKFEVTTETGKGTIITNSFSLSNHMTGGKCIIPESSITSITDGKTAFTITTFIEFCTLNTGA